LGLNHEQQHQELMLTDIKHVFWMNPLRPAFRNAKEIVDNASVPVGWQYFEGGIYSVGHDGNGFHFDNEGLRHEVLLQPFALGTRLITNREYLEFMEDGGYTRPGFWLSLGWTAVNEREWNAPFYWEKLDGKWMMLSLAGMREVNWNEP